jgi:hypothetical protein
MIVSVSGRIGSGKDMVGSTIQVLTALSGEGLLSYATPKLILEFQEERSRCDYEDPTEWQIKKFADKLKDIVSIILGCTREQLEDRDFKEGELGEEWWRYRAHDGSVYRNCAKQVYDKKPKNERLVDKLTPRKILQLLGTEAGRFIIHDDIWINSMFSDYKPDTSNWITTDTRFPNELEAVKERGGITIVVKRPETDHLAGDHASETALGNSTLDEVIVNDGSLEDLIEKVKEILARRGII